MMAIRNLNRAGVHSSKDLPSSCSGQCHKVRALALTLTCLREDVGQTAERPLPDHVDPDPAVSNQAKASSTFSQSNLQYNQRRFVKKLWQEFFADPSCWWDNRAEKVNARYPDFKHKKTEESLWLNSKANPPWVEAALAAMAPGTLQVDIFTWNRRLARHAKAGRIAKTLELLQQMQEEGMSPDKFTFVPILNACSRLRALEEGRCVHSQVIKAGHESDVYVGSCLVDMYANCGSIEDAELVFNRMPTRNVVVWNAMILGHVKCGQARKALGLSRQMKWDGVDQDPITIVGMVNACASTVALEEGRLIHEQIIRRGWESDIIVSNSLVDMYSKCGSIEDAWTTFNNMEKRDVVSWNAMILGYVKCGQGHKALDLSRQMSEEGVRPNAVTFVGLLNACAGVAAVDEGRHLHEQIIQQKLESDAFVGSSLVDMYAKCGSIGDALATFNKMPVRDVASWNSMISGHVKCGQGRKALELFVQMQEEEVDPSPATFVGLLNACAGIVALEVGRRLHQQIIQRGWETDVFMSNSLIDMYAKCGSIEDAQGVFNKMIRRDVVSWNAMLGGFAMHGHARMALQHFELMCQEGMGMNEVTSLSLLSACSHGGLLAEGLHYFNSMQGHNVSSTVDHYSCVVDILGRAGHLHEAEDVLKMMSCEPNVTVWTSLLGACRTHGNVEIGERVALEVLEVDPENSAGYVLLSNIYATAGKWNSMVKVQQERCNSMVSRVHFEKHDTMDSAKL